MCVNIFSIKRIFSNQSHYFPDIPCMLLLYGVSYSKRNYQEENLDREVPKYTIGYLSNASLLRSAYSRTPDSFFHRQWWGREEYIRRITTAIYFRISGFFSWTQPLLNPTRSRRNEVLTLAGSSNCGTGKQKCWFGDFSSWIFWAIP